MLCEMQSVLSRIWTRVVVSISYDDNHYTTGTNLTTLFHCSIVQSLCTWAHRSLLTLFCFLNSGFLVAILPWGPNLQSLLLPMDVDTFFSWHWFSCAVIFGAVYLLLCKQVTLMKLSFALVVTFGLILSQFVMSPNSIIYCSSGKFYF